MMDDSDTTIMVREVDSLVANEFTLLINGQLASGVFSISGLMMGFGAAGEAKEQPVTVSKMVQRDPHAPFNTWLRETIDAHSQGAALPTRNVTVVAVDDGTEIRRWVLHEAQIARVSYSDFDSGSAEMMQERLVLEYRRIEQSWSAQG